MIYTLLTVFVKSFAVVLSSQPSPPTVTDISLLSTLSRLAPYEIQEVAAIRLSVDGLYRDGTVHISREQHKQFAAKRLAELTDIAHRPYSSHRKALRVDTNLARHMSRFANALANANARRSSCLDRRSVKLTSGYTSHYHLLQGTSGCASETGHKADFL